MAKAFAEPHFENQENSQSHNRMQAQDRLHEVFRAFSTYGKGSTRSKGSLDKDEMDNQRFAKLCKDCGLYDKQFTTTDADIVFMKVKTKGTRKITYKQFQTALSLVSEKKAGGYEAVVRAIIESEGPKTNATAPSYVKHHDNQGSYCGIYRRGGPGVVDYSPEMAFEKMSRPTRRTELKSPYLNNNERFAASLRCYD